jgi:O-antigen/teichoic acid export membrane protein
MSIATTDVAEQTCATKRRFAPDSLAASVAILLVVSVVQRSVGFGRGVLFCRWLAPEELGRWDMAYSFLLLAAPLVVLGLPGCFGRYLERYRKRGQLRAFLHRTATWTAVLSGAAIGAMLWAWPVTSDLVFGKPDQKKLVWWMCAALAAVILHHFLEALFAALRKFRIVSAMQMCQSFTFAAISLCLLWWWRLAAESIIVGYGAACLISIAATLLLTGRSLAEEAAAGESVPHAEFWPPLVRFAVWIWFTNLLCNMFAVVDRYMLVHYSGFDSVTALEQVGNYHSSRVVPLLLISLADLLASILMPYLSHDWERGEKRLVSDRINLVLKLTALGMLGISVAVLWGAPLLFQVAFENKYAAGLEVLPWTLTFCVWYALLIVAQNFIWCAEKTKLGSLPLGIGLVANILLNFALLPIWGLQGAVLATTFSTGLALGLLYWLNHRAGMELPPGLIWLTAAPIALGGGPWLASAAFLLLVLAVPFSRILFNDRERGQLGGFLRQQLEIAFKPLSKQSKSAVSG